MFPDLVFAAESDLEELVVYGRAQEQVGAAHAASEGMVGYDDIQSPPLLRVGELVESVPGMVATQHSGTGKANQYFLRGFNLDHGTDFAALLDGVPINMRSHGHGQGYLDLNFLIPELVETTRYRKGPYAASVGDFSAAGSVEFQLYGRLRESMAQATLGKDGYQRLLAITGTSGDEPLMLALDVTRYDGPWVLGENTDQKKVYLTKTIVLDGGRLRLSAQGYSSAWDSTDQIPLRAVSAGLIDELGFIDPNLGGDSSRYALTGDVEFDSWRVGGYYIDYSFSLWSNFTYLLSDPANGDEFEQRDDRTIAGAWFKADRETGIFGSPTNLSWGGDLRRDNVGAVGLYPTSSRQRYGVVREDSLNEISLSTWGESETYLNPDIRLVLGVRADYFNWDVNARLPINSGSGSDVQVSPKVGLAYRFSAGFEAYASYGRGFHSNDVRGATITTDPLSGDPVDKVDVFVPATGREVGARYERGRRFNTTLSLFELQLDSELVYVGDGGSTEPNDATLRRGLEATLFWQATEQLSFNAAYTYTNAEFEQDQGGGVEIPGAIEQTFVVGANGVFDNGVSGSIRLRYLGAAPLVEDNSVRGSESILVNAGLAWRTGPYEFRFDAFNLLDSSDHDISYFYASRLAGEPDDGVEDIHFHPLEPRSWRITATYHW